MAPPIDRRDFLKGAAALGVLPLTGTLADCGGARSPDGSGDSSGGDLPGNLNETADFDFPLALPLPFAHGVASGDPLKDRVIIWTRITETTPSANTIPVHWSVSTTPDFARVLKSGTQMTNAARDWTVKVDVTGLAPATSYYYRFAAFGRSSIVGRTRTAPDTAVDSIRFAVLSCSSYWSSYWSGLSHIADRNDLDLVVHCGDYIYDFVDEDETVRARKDRKDTALPDYRDWLDIGELRRRYALWRSDANNLRAHQQHPWFIVWDNHDLDEDYGNELPTPLDGQKSTTTLAQTTQVFWEWTPSRPVRADGSGDFVLVDDGSYPEPEDSQLVWRRLPYGPLLDVFGVDTQIGLPGHGLTMDASHLAAGNSLMGRRQFEWLTTAMQGSAQAGVTWRFVNNQTWLAPCDTPDVIDGLPSLPKLGISRWSDYPEERAALMQYLRGDNDASFRVRNNIVVSGDVHGNFGSDLIESPALLSNYVPAAPLPNLRQGSTAANFPAGFGRAGTGNPGPLNLRAASVGVEFAPTSMGRGGGDEMLANWLQLPPGSAPTIVGTRALETALITANKNVQFIEWVDHGYGIVDINSERALFEYWWQDKLTPDSPDVLGRQMVAWAQQDTNRAVARFQDQLDDVSAHGMPVAASSGTRSAEPAPLDPSVLQPR
ncbi:alkaline phosphatase D family protein [Solimonas terrae]|uniref:Twin-arginine translocation signal domain-containing protein n=1 Tax=Solimonas terrae TaxID=1396819 RepID=A0A6M2BWA4_9GAMM|nr:alkaline phosphatase D family protein [Solimonas terrae]NGY06423.1 twin-arginine translocation signal domain-containing protein [Solimonas terrae]